MAGAPGDRSAGNLGMLQQRLLDFRGLNAVSTPSADVRAAQKLQFAFSGPTAQIARSVDALAGVEWIFDESLAG